MPRGRPVKPQNDNVSECSNEEKKDTVKSYVAVWDIRLSWNSDINDIYVMQNALDEIAKRWVFQIEKGNETGYIHLQGRISLIKKEKNKHKILDMFPENYKPNYIEPTVNPEFTVYESSGKAFYQMKADTRIEGPYTNENQKPFIPREYNIPYDKLYSFQKRIYDDNDSYKSHRLVNLIYHPPGCGGKSTIAMICKLIQNAVILPYIDDPVQLMYAAHNQISAKGLRTNVKIFIDLPRAINKKMLSTYLLTIENLKSGYLYDMRNKWKEWVISPPIVYVFSNRLPNLDDLSADRWRIWLINDKKDLVKYKFNGLMAVDSGHIPCFNDNDTSSKSSNSESYDFIDDSPVINSKLVIDF